MGEIMKSVRSILLVVTLPMLAITLSPAEAAMSKPQRTLVKGVAEFTFIADVCADRLTVKIHALGPAMTSAGVDAGSPEARGLMDEEVKRLTETLSEHGKDKLCTEMVRRHAGNGFVQKKQQERP